jgi:cytochrome P450
MSGTDRVMRKIGCSGDNEPIEVENLTSEYATQVLASCMFGVEVSDVAHYKQVEESLEAIFNPSFFRYAIMVLGLVNVKIYNKLKLQRVPKKAMDTFAKLIRDIVCYRNQEVRRDDVLQTILDLRSQETESTHYEDIFTDDCIPLMFNFMTAGIKPASVTITFALYQVARHPLVQETLHKEISEALRTHGGWSHEAVEDMVYLDRVILETLRMYSFNLVVVRSVTKPYTLPGTDVTLEKDMMVLIPVDSLQKDPDFYPEPEVCLHIKNYNLS